MTLEKYIWYEEILVEINWVGLNGLYFDRDLRQEGSCRGSNEKIFVCIKMYVKKEIEKRLLYVRKRELVQVMSYLF